MASNDKPRFQVIDCNPNAPLDPTWKRFVERNSRKGPPLVKAAVAGSPRADSTPTHGEHAEACYTELDVARMAGISGAELRQWEAVFPMLEPIEGTTMRVYRRSDVDLVMEIRRLLFEERLSMLQVRRRLSKR